jgi:hypothetical protein
VHQACPCEIPIDEAWYRPYGIKRKPEHQIFRTVPAINGDQFIHSNAQVVYQPVPHTCYAFEELFVCPCFPFEYEEWVIWLITEGLIFEDVVGQNAPTDCAIVHEVHDIWGLGKAAPVMLEVVREVVFGVEVGGYSGCASCSCNYWY